MKKEGRTQLSNKIIILQDEHNSSFEVRFMTKDEAGKQVWTNAARTPLDAVSHFFFTTVERSLNHCGSRSVYVCIYTLLSSRYCSVGFLLKLY